MVPQREKMAPVSLGVGSQHRAAGWLPPEWGTAKVPQSLLADGGAVLSGAEKGLCSAPPPRVTRQRSAAPSPTPPHSLHLHSPTDTAFPDFPQGALPASVPNTHTLAFVP